MASSMADSSASASVSVEAAGDVSAVRLRRFGAPLIGHSGAVIWGACRWVPGGGYRRPRFQYAAVGSALRTQGGGCPLRVRPPMAEWGRGGMSTTIPFSPPAGADDGEVLLGSPDA